MKKMYVPRVQFPHGVGYFPRVFFAGDIFRRGTFRGEYFQQGSIFCGVYFCEEGGGLRIIKFIRVIQLSGPC